MSIETAIGLAVGLLLPRQHRGARWLGEGDPAVGRAHRPQAVEQVVGVEGDLDLGPGDDGLVLAAKARRRWPELQVIYATSSPEKLEGHSVRPWEKVFFKPFDPAALAAAIFARGEAAPEMAR